ncbi:hypothetical protein PCE1_002367 [Barthelona sp. PCE]
MADWYNQICRDSLCANPFIDGAIIIGPDGTTWGSHNFVVAGPDATKLATACDQTLGTMIKVNESNMMLVVQEEASDDASEMVIMKGGGASLVGFKCLRCMLFVLFANDDNRPLATEKAIEMSQYLISLSY